jgi:hypothetical protein
LKWCCKAQPTSVSSWHLIAVQQCLTSTCSTLKKSEGITTAAGALQKDGLIAYSRGKLTVLNRKGLERASCGCYAADQKTYAELL